MKKFLSLLLALCLIGSLVGCGRTEPTVLEPPDVSGDTLTYPEPEELLSRGYGVDPLESLTLGLNITLDQGDYGFEYEGIYEQTEDAAHFQLSMVGVEDGNGFNFYYDMTSQILYYFSMVSLEWEGEHADTFDVGFNKLANLTAEDFITDSVVLVPKVSDFVFDVKSENARFEMIDELSVEGTADKAVVDSLVSLFYTIEFEPQEVNTRFVYTASTHVLKSMHWDVKDGSSTLKIDADVLDTNKTTITYPFDVDTVVVDSDVDDIWNSVDGVREGEVLLAEEYFGVDYVRENDFLAGIDAEYRDLHEGILYLARYYYNSYSREGFARMLAQTVPTIEEEPMAAVLVCELTGIPWDVLYAGNFMTESDVSNCRSDLYHHIYGSDALEP